jgi:unsaturated rhamnogalacturonyl hydrolase
MNPIAAQPAAESAPWSVRMAESVIDRNPVLMDRWHYELGLVMEAFERLWEHTGDERYYDYLKQNLDQFIQADGSIETYDLEDYNLDQIASGKLLFVLYERTGDERYRRAADTLRKQLREHPRTSEGGFWHKKVYPYQLWLDGVYMAGPFLARYGVDFNDAEAIDEITHEILLVARYMRDPQTGLYYHGWDESREQLWADSITGLSKNFWGRGMGWFGMALVDVLDYLPREHEDRDEILRILRRFADAVVKVQDPVTGLWYQVLDQPQRPENYLEASASNMLIYMLAKGVRQDYLAAEYLDVARRAYDGVISSLIEVDDEGRVNLDGTVSVGGLGGKNQRDGSFEYYMSEPIHLNDNKGVGPFIMASLELEVAAEHLSTD